MMNRLIIDKVRGCLLGGAIGDALGYSVEFNMLRDIRRIYGESGITFYTFNESGEAEISDDTQMTMYTANGLLMYMSEKLKHNEEPEESGVGVVECIHAAYMEWLKTQKARFDRVREVDFKCWITNDPRMWAVRAPGNTCMSALGSHKIGSRENKLNSSKGCGGVMRVAPIGIYMHQLGLDYVEVLKLGCDAAAITHGHPCGYLAAGLFADIIARLLYSQNLLQYSAELFEVEVCGALMDLSTTYHMASMQKIQSITKKANVESEDDMDEATKLEVKKAMLEADSIGVISSLVSKAIELAHEDMDDASAIEQLGRGWIAEEAIAIAIYCVSKYRHNLSEALIAAVNHDGDSDSTGAIAGNMIGAIVGYSGITKEWLENLECKDIIYQLATDLCLDIRDWKSRY